MAKIAVTLFFCSVAIAFGIFAWVYLAADYFDYCDGQREAAGGPHIFWSYGPAQGLLLNMCGSDIQPFMY